MCGVCTEGRTALVSLENLDFFASMIRSPGAYTDLTTLSRSYLLQCRAGTSVRAVLAYGQLSTGPDNYNLLTFLVLPYRPRSVSAASWAVYRSVAFTRYSSLRRTPVLPVAVWREKVGTEE